MKIFHHNDLDGHCSGAIAYNFYNRIKGINPVLFEINYNIDFPFGMIKPNETVVILDYSLPDEEDFKELLHITDKVIWIDHHKTAIEKYEGLGLLGSREDGTAACVLTWHYFNPMHTIPCIVEMLGHYDVWDFSRWDKEMLTDLQLGISLYNHLPDSELWSKWFRGFGVRELIEEGSLVSKYRKKFYADQIRNWSFITEFEGYKAICCNMGLAGSQLFDSVASDYDLMIPFVFDGSNWIFSLYTKKDNIDCSELAKKYGGGGHKKAAGFKTKKIPFKVYNFATN